MARKLATEVIEVRAEWWDEGETVTLRKYLTHGMKRELDSVLNGAIQFEDGYDPQKPLEKIKFDMAKVMNGSNDLQLRLFTVRWTLKGEDGNILKLCGEELDNLSEEDYNFILAEIDKLNASNAVSEQEKADFLAQQNDGTPVKSAG